MNTLEEIIKQNSSPSLLRSEILKVFDKDISGIKNESVFLLKDVPSVKVYTNAFFMFVDSVSQNFHNIYYEMTEVDSNLKDLKNHLKYLTSNFKNDVDKLNRSYLQTDFYLTGLKSRTQSAHISTISNLLQDTFECYRILFNSYLDKSKQLSKDDFAKEMFGNGVIGFLEAPDKIVIKE